MGLGENEEGGARGKKKKTNVMLVSELPAAAVTWQSNLSKIKKKQKKTLFCTGNARTMALCAHTTEMRLFLSSSTPCSSHFLFFFGSLVFLHEDEDAHASVL